MPCVKCPKVVSGFNEGSYSGILAEDHVLTRATNLMQGTGPTPSRTYIARSLEQIIAGLELRILHVLRGILPPITEIQPLSLAT